MGKILDILFKDRDYEYALDKNEKLFILNKLSSIEEQIIGLCDVLENLEKRISLLEDK